MIRKKLIAPVVLLSTLAVGGPYARAASKQATPRGLVQLAEAGKPLEAKYAAMTEALEAEIRKILPFLSEQKKKALQDAQEALRATSLELARPMENNTAKVQSKKSDDAGAFEASDESKSVDPVKRCLAYEKAYLNGELDPAFKTFSTWEYRMVINSLDGDEVLAWGREMIRNYRPDYVTNDYGFRYSALVKSDVKYGSEGCKNDRPELNQYQNILKDGGVCGRRAFFGRFILRANGIPVWGVTQRKHAALSHWTPKGWVVNLGAGFNQSWWDKGDVPLSGADFLLEAQARRHPADFTKVLRAQWVSRILGEQAYNGRRGVAGGLWSSLGHYKAGIIASQEVSLGPLGEELAEANLPEGAEAVEQATVTKEEQMTSMGRDGRITIPAVAHGKSSGSGVAMKSHGGGMQLLGSEGFKTQYEFEAPRAGKYTLSAQVVTVQENKKFAFAANDAAAVEVQVPYTIGIWKQTEPIEVSLNKGHNVLRFEVQGEGRTAIKDLTLSPLR